MDPSFVPNDIPQGPPIALLWIAVGFVALFGLMIWAFVSFARPVVPKADREVGSPPAQPTILQAQNVGFTSGKNAPPAPNALAWT